MARPLPAPAMRSVAKTPSAVPKSAKLGAIAHVAPSISLKWNPEMQAMIQKLSPGASPSNDARVVALLAATPPDNGLSILFNLLQYDAHHNALAMVSSPQLSDALLRLVSNANTAALGLLVNILTQPPAHAPFMLKNGPRQLLSLVSLSQPATTDLALKGLQNLLAAQPAETAGAFLTPEDLTLLVKVAAPAQLSGNTAARTALLTLNYLAASHQHRPHLRDAGFVPVLVRVITSPTSGPLRAEALEALAALSRIELRTSDLSASFFEAVFAALDAPDTVLQAHACAVLANLAAHDSPDALIAACAQRPSAAPRLLRLCESASPSVHKPALLAASNLLSHESTHSFFLYAHCASLLLSLVEGPISTREAALTALVHLSLYYEEGRTAIVSAGGIATMHRVIKDPNTPSSVRDEALKTVLNMSLSDDAETALLAQGIVPPLVALMGAQSPAMQKELAVLTLSNLSLSADGRLAIGAAGGLKAATSLLQTPHPDLQIQSAELLSRLALSGANRMAFRLEGGLTVAHLVAQNEKNEAVKHALAVAMQRLQLPAETEDAAQDITHEPEKERKKKPPIKTETVRGVVSPPRVPPNNSSNSTTSTNVANSGNNRAPQPPPRLNRSLTSPSMRFSAPGTTTYAPVNPPAPSSPPPISKGSIRRLPQSPASNTSKEHAELPPRPLPPNTSATADLPPRPRRSPSISHTSPTPPLNFTSSTSPPAAATSPPAYAPPRKALPKPPATRSTIGSTPSSTLSSSTTTTTPVSPPPPLVVKPAAAATTSTPSLPEEEVDLSLQKEAWVVADEPEVKREHNGRFRPVLDFIRRLGNPAAVITKLRRPTSPPPLTRKQTYGANSTPALAGPTTRHPLSSSSSPNVSSAWAASTSPPSPGRSSESGNNTSSSVSVSTQPISSSPPAAATLPPRPVVSLTRQPTNTSLPPRPVVVTTASSLPNPGSPLTDTVNNSAVISSSSLKLPAAPITSPSPKSSPRAAVASSSRDNSPRSPLAVSSPSLNRSSASLPPLPQPQEPKVEFAVKEQDPATLHKRRTHIAQELLETEGTYCRNLTVIIKKFYNPLIQISKTKKPFITPEQVRAIFSNVEIIFSYHTLLLEALNGRMRRWSPSQRVGDVFLQLGEFLKVYTAYVNNYDTAQKTLEAAIASSSRLANFLANVTKLPACNKLDLPSFLIMPVQRVPRYSLLLRDLVKSTSKEHPDYEYLCRALSQIDKVAVTLNIRKSEAEHQATITEIARRLAGDAPLLKELVHPARRFIREGDVKTQEAMSGTPSTGGKHDSLLFLFNDAVLFADTGLTGRPRARALVLFSAVLGCSSTEKRKLVIATTSHTIWTVTLATSELRDTWVADIQEAWKTSRSLRSE